MTLKTYYPKLLWNTLVKRCWYGAASFLLLFVAMPLTSMLSFDGAEELARNASYWFSLQDAKEEFAEFASGCNLFIFIIVIGLALLGAWSGLAWLHSKKKMDLYGSLPVKREVLYGMECLVAILWFLFSYVGNLVLMLLVGVQKGLFTGKALKFGVYSIGIYFLGFLAFYFCAAVAMMLTGKVLTGILGTFVFLGIAPVTILLLTALPDLFFVSYVTTSGFWQQIAIRLSPVIVLFEIIEEIVSYIYGHTEVYVTIVPIITLVIWSVVWAVASVILLKIRPAEGAEQSMVFPKTEGVIKGLILYPIAIGGGLFFWEMGGNYGEYGWLWFGLIFVVLVISILIEVIYHHDRKRVFGHKLSTGISTVAAVLTILFFQFDFLGMDSWIPEKDEVESMVLTRGNLDTWFSYPDGSYSSGEYLRNNIDSASGGDIIYEYLPEGLELTEKYRDMRNGVIDEDEYYETYGSSTSVTIVFKMKNGTEKERRYFLSSESLDALCEQLYDEELYKEAWMPLLTLEDDKCQVTYLHYELEEIDLFDWSVNENREFVNIYKDELRNMTYDQIFNGDDDLGFYMDLEDEDGNWMSGTYPLNENFVKSIAYLENMIKENGSGNELAR